MAVNTVQAQSRLIAVEEYEQMVRAGGHPTAPDLLLVIEVADMSADYDRTVKISLYGRSAVPEAWLIDLSGRTIEVFRGPDRSGYREKRTVAPCDHLSPLALPDIDLSVADILGAHA